MVITTYLLEIDIVLFYSVTFQWWYEAREYIPSKGSSLGWFGNTILSIAYGKVGQRDVCRCKLIVDQTSEIRNYKERKDLLIDVEEEVEEGRDTEDEEEQGKAKDYESIIVYDSFDDRYYPDDDHSTNKFNSNRNDVGLRPINDFANHDLNSIIFNTKGSDDNGGFNNELKNGLGRSRNETNRNIFTWSSCSSVHLITSPIWIIQTSDHQPDQDFMKSTKILQFEFITNLPNIMKPKLARVAPNDPEYGNEMLLLLRHYYSNHRLLHWILINEHIGLSEEWFEKWLENLFKETAPTLQSSDINVLQYNFTIEVGLVMNNHNFTLNICQRTLNRNKIFINSNTYWYILLKYGLYGSLLRLTTILHLYTHTTTLTMYLKPIIHIIIHSNMRLALNDALLDEDQRKNKFKYVPLGSSNI
ncbi:LOW QUALITY PROTEIN: hypothetical protein V1477_021139 [Vespula maculifrons]|uniref:Uncharacterized protein n=1 Tax=Vespula maculifrons TaxID=7453 RepID=A0ABD2AI66_VESMC